MSTSSAGTNVPPDNDSMLTKPVQFLKGVGPQRAELLQRLGLRVAMDLLFYFPRDYRDMSELRTIDELEENSSVSVCGHVEEVELRNTGPGRSVLVILVRQDDQYLRAVWFNQPFMRDRLRQGQRVLLSGEPRWKGGRWELAHPRVESLADDQEEPTGQILPIYPSTDGLSQFHLRRIVQQVVEECVSEVEEVFPPSYLNRHALQPLREALPQIHFPDSQDSLEKARRRFIYQELLVLQLAVALRRLRLTAHHRAAELPVSAQIDARIRRLLPFELTTGQDQAIQDISSDLARPTPMNRLLQGDVGSGKTVVAVYTMLVAVAHGNQAVLMAPTEVLARQHYHTLVQLLRTSQVRLGLLTGSLSDPQRKDVLQRIENGTLDVVVGTQALLHVPTTFSKLGLVIIDEQHKFGVQQRAGLRQSNSMPHYLVMTATPIPRTISMTVFGDLDVTSLRESPPGRQPVQTYLGQAEQREQWWDFFRRKLREGRQGYVIVPRVDASSESDLKSVEEAFEELANGELEAFRVNLVHGRLSSEEKTLAMTEFGRGETQVLVATSVVEVGVDVPNASVMTIENGDRFGLAQLHQLRGRISRGSHPGYLCVFSSAGSAEGHERLEAFVSNDDGFELAEIDFRLRGPGDLFSSRQHGLPPFHIADLLRDKAVLHEARRDAQELMAEDPELLADQHARLRRMVLGRYGQALDLSDVG